MRFPSAEETLAAIEAGESWHVERCDSPQRTATGPEGRTTTVTDNVIVLRREG